MRDSTCFAVRKPTAVLLIGFGLGACIAAPTAAMATSPIEPGDYVITQESPAARHAAKSRTAGSAIFLLKASGKIETLAVPPAVSGPRGIREDKDGSLIFADALGSAIGRIMRDGTLKTVFRGAPLAQPKDIALDRDGGYVIADFPAFTSSSGAKVLKLSSEGKMSVLYSGAPLVWPHGIAVDGSGNYVIADHSCCVYRLTPAGQITLVAQGDPLVAPQDIKIDSDGSYIATDIGRVVDPRTGLVDPSRSRNPGKLLRITPDGQVHVLARVPMARFRAVAPANEGGFLVIEMMGNTVYRYAAGGGPPSVVYQGAPLSQPSGIVQVR